MLAISLLVAPQASWAYPFWAQQNYDNPREATGKIVCANCHLAKKLTQVEVPQAVMPNTVFKAVVKIPYDTAVQQVAADGSRSGRDRYELSGVPNHCGMLPIVTCDPGVTGVHWLSASHVRVAFAGTVKVPEPLATQATTARPDSSSAQVSGSGTAATAARRRRWVFMMIR